MASCSLRVECLIRGDVYVPVREFHVNTRLNGNILLKVQSLFNTTLKKNYYQLKLLNINNVSVVYTTVVNAKSEGFSNTSNTFITIIIVLSAVNRVIKTKPSKRQNKVFYWKTCSSTRQIGSVPSSADSGDWSETITSALS